jgi:hypothetical protein
MPASEATVKTQRADRYLSQLLRHATKMNGHRLHRPPTLTHGGTAPEIWHAECSETDGTVILNWGQWSVHAAPGSLTLRAESDDNENLRRIQDLITMRLEKIGRRDHLTVSWYPAVTPGNASVLPRVRRGPGRASPSSRHLPR